MLKIWLTWLQPSLGILGTALVLSLPLCSNATPKPIAVRTPTQPPQWSSVKSRDTTIEQELANGIAGTPDLAIRQLAISSMGASTVGMPTSPNVKARKATPGNLASALSRSAKTKKPQQVKHSAALALARKSQPKTTVVVPGLFIGNTDIHVSNNFSPSVKPLARPVASATEIGTPTPLSAMMGSRTVVDPFPVVRPELMQKLQGVPTVASVSPIQSAPYALNPIAAIPSKLSKSAAPQSLDPIADIPSGLQRLLGNNLNSQPIIVAATPVAKAIASKPGSLVALQKLVSPSAATPVSISAASLQLATSQAYSSVPKFSIPGETVLAAKPTVDLLVTKRVQPNLITLGTVRKNNYVAIMGDRNLTPATRQSWTVVDRQNPLGGLILGSQPLATVSRVVSLLPAGNTRTSGLIGRNLADFN
jgi:hypothetical protein